MAHQFEIFAVGILYETLQYPRWSFYDLPIFQCLYFRQKRPTFAVNNRTHIKKYKNDSSSNGNVACIKRRIGTLWPFLRPSECSPTCFMVKVVKTGLLLHLLSFLSLPR